MSEIKISVVDNAVSTETRDVSVGKILQATRTGGKKLKEQVTQIRNRMEMELTRTGDFQKAKKAVEGLKKQLPGITWSARLKTRDKDVPLAEKLIAHSGLMCADLDSLGSNKAAVHAKLKTSHHVFALFVSPSGDGLKAIFRVPADASKHAGSFRAVERHVLDLTGIQIDQSGKDVVRLCFMSFDPALYHNLHATEIEPSPEPEQSQRLSNGVVNLSERQRIATDLLRVIDWQSETSGYLVCPGKHLHTTDDGERDCRIDLDDIPTVHCFHNSCRGILAGINHELRSRIAKTELTGIKQHGQKATANQTARDDARSDLTSLSSLGAAEYPAELEESAFYGLAGEIVRRIEPHTEADPVALLIQLLVAFGNIIGRSAYMVADAVRHYANLAVVLVGETSKGRKGTAFQNVLNVLQHVDGDWCKNNIASGLSSGEGLIWSVRDQIEEDKPIKEKGRYTEETQRVVTDGGVKDKRLFVVEAEFANTLKVATREGNILSAVIRQAWETGSLRIMTKNSPARATGAHISIIGHITRQENRRLLTETESANGFGNRFLWSAVRRSKCLPEGGSLPAIADLIVRLHDAIEFARYATEVKRSDAARKLWTRVYPQLSEGKPGLLGAITARAEAQVLRVSMIYALLDCSTTVEEKHLRAALALWRYCEDSAQWIFESGSGNKSADRILAALKAAGEQGLTKWQITTNVFNRHATKFEIDEALRLLHSLKLATCVRENTATRPAERWFYNATACEVCEESTTEPCKTGDTSHSSHPLPSKTRDSTHPDTNAIPDELSAELHCVSSGDEEGEI